MAHTVWFNTVYSIIINHKYIVYFAATSASSTVTPSATPSASARQSSTPSSVTRQSLPSTPSTSQSTQPSSTGTSLLWHEHRRLFGFQATATSSVPPRKRTATRTAKPKEAKKMKEPTWTRKFVCLHEKKAQKVPSSGEYVTLKRASLGEKKTTFLLSDTCHNVDQKLKETFPKLELAGGYTLASSTITRQLQKIDPPYSALRLKESTGQGKIFIIPLQQNLDLTPDVLPEEEGVRCMSV